MSNVLGSNSFLSTPDVNGVPVLLEGDAVGTLSGTTDQISVTGTNPAQTIALASNPIIPGIARIKIPVGATADRPGTPVTGDLRFNTSLLRTEIYNGTSWSIIGNVIQTVTGVIAATSTNVIIPYDNTLPTSTEGAEIWSQSFTPLSASSTIVISTMGFYSVNNAADINTTLAVFNGTTCIDATNVGWTTTTLDTRSFNVMTVQASDSTTARTYSARIGPNVAQTVFVCRATTGAIYGGTANQGRFMIQEILN